VAQRYLSNAIMKPRWQALCAKTARQLERGFPNPAARQACVVN